MVNSAEHIIELFEKRGAIYSDRPPLYVSGEIAGWDRALALSHYDDHMRDLRRLFAPLLGTRKAVEQFLPMLDEQSRKFLLRVKEYPDQLEAQARK